MDDKIIAVIDIGTTKTVAIVGRVGADRSVQVLGYAREASIGVRRGVVYNLHETARSVERAMSAARARAGIAVDTVYVGTAGEHIRTSFEEATAPLAPGARKATARDVAACIEKARRAVEGRRDTRYELVDIIPAQYSLDGAPWSDTLPQAAGQALSVRFHVVEGEVQVARMLHRCVGEVGLRLEKVFLEPVASAAAVLTDDEKERGVALVDIGGGTTDVAVYVAGALQFTAVVPWGGQIVTDDIATTFGVTPAQAERAKVRYGNVVPRSPEIAGQVLEFPDRDGGRREIPLETMSRVAGSRVSEILEYVHYELDARGLAPRLGAGVRVTGGGALLRNLPQLASYVFGAEARVAGAQSRVAGLDVPPAELPMYSTAVGLLLCGYAESRFRGDVEAQPLPGPEALEQAAKGGQERSGRTGLFGRASGLLNKLGNLPAVKAASEFFDVPYDENMNTKI